MAEFPVGAVPPDTYVGTTGAQTVAGEKTFTGRAIFRNPLITAEWLDVRDPRFGGAADNTTDDTAAWQALADVIGDHDTARPAEVYVPGWSRITEPVRFRRRVIKMRGRGAGPTGQGSGFRADFATPDLPLIQCRESIGSVFEDFRLLGDGTQSALLEFYRGPSGQRVVNDAVLNGTTTVTSAAANFTEDDWGARLVATGIPAAAYVTEVVSESQVIMSVPATATASGVSLTIAGESGPNIHNTVRKVHFGQYFGYDTEPLSAEHAILFSGGNENNDQSLIDDCMFYAISGVEFTGTQNVLSHIKDSKFYYGVHAIKSVASFLATNMFCTGQTEWDIDLASAARAVLKGYSAEHSAGMAILRGSNTLKVESGGQNYFQYQDNLNADGRLIHAVHNDGNCTIDLEDFAFEDVGYTNPATPNIAARSAGGAVHRTVRLSRVRFGSSFLVAPANLDIVPVGAGTTTLYGEFPTAGVGWQRVASVYQVLAPGGAVDLTADDRLLPTNVQIFTANGTWTKPTGAYKTVDVEMIGGGGGGGAGRRGAAGSVRCGGGGGGGGGYSRASFPFSVCPATQAVTVGTGGAGAPAVAADDTSGSTGSTGTGSQWGVAPSANPALVSGGGTGGGGGTAAAGAAGTGGLRLVAGLAGAAASATGLAGSSPGTGSTYGAVGGGSGGGLTTGNAASAGGNGGAAGSNFRAGGVGGAIDSAGAAPVISAAAGEPAGGAGGGGGGSSVAGPGGAGGAAGNYGGGGGGGGASVNGQNSGAGGAGAAGIVIVTTYA